MAEHIISIKRAYAPADAGDGMRILVDRLWPRGLSKERLALDVWAKDIAPTTPLRKAFGHMEENFPVFRAAYLQELDSNPAAAQFRQQVMEELRGRNVTLVYGARSETANHALVLRDWLMGDK